jgi:hypothetical protein
VRLLESAGLAGRLPASQPPREFFSSSLIPRGHTSSLPRPFQGSPFNHPLDSTPAGAGISPKNVDGEEGACPNVPLPPSAWRMSMNTRRPESISMQWTRTEGTHSRPPLSSPACPRKRSSQYDIRPLHADSGSARCGQGGRNCLRHIV